MTIVAVSCDCKMWDKIGAPDNIPDAVYGGIHWLTNKEKAVELWRKLEVFNIPYWINLIPYYWAVHLDGKHIVNVLGDEK